MGFGRIPEGSRELNADRLLVGGVGVILILSLALFLEFGGAGDPDSPAPGPREDSSVGNEARGPHPEPPPSAPDGTPEASGDGPSVEGATGAGEDEPIRIGIRGTVIRRLGEGSIRGTVHPAAHGLEVRLLDHHHQIVARRTCDTQGRFAFENVPIAKFSYELSNTWGDVRYALRASAPGYATTFAGAIEPGIGNPQRLTLAGGGRISCRILDRTGEIIEGGIVKLEWKPEGEMVPTESMEVRADARGRVDLVDLPPDTSIIHFYATRPDGTGADARVTPFRPARTDAFLGTEVEFRVW